MKTQEAAQFLDIASSTLRQWTLYEFKEFLSSEAQGDGSRRNFKSMDLRILSFIADLKKDNHTADEIRETLRQMKEGGWKNLPELPDVSEEQSRIEVMMSNAEVMIDEREKALRMQISLLSAEIDDVREQLQGERQENKQLYKQISELERELGDAKGQLQTLEKQRDREDKALEEQRQRTERERATTIRLVIAVAIAALLIGGIIGFLVFRGL